MKASAKQLRDSQLIAQYSIGLKLRALRSEKRLTLAHLARETGLSTALLSKLETQRMIPTLPTLAKLCAMFGVGLDYFFSDSEQHSSLSITRKEHIVGSARRQEMVKAIPLHTPKADETMIARVLEFPPGAPSTVGKRGEITEIAAYVIEGTLQVDFAGNREALNAGDCVVLKSSAPVFWGARDNVTCKVFAVTARLSLQEQIRR